jgi:hypothetical protein
MDQDVELPFGSDPKISPWLSKMMFADLTQLAKLAPFSNKNLIGHMMKDRIGWKKFYSQSDAPLRFKDLPNRAMLDFHLLLTDGTDQKKDPERQADDEGLQDQQLSRGPSLEKIDKDTTNSDERDGTRAENSMKRTESEILNDPEIWNISESEIDTESEAEDDIGNRKRTSGNDKKTEQVAETKE